MASWVYIIVARNRSVRVTRDEDEAWLGGREVGSTVTAIPVIDLPVQPEPDPPFSVTDDTPERLAHPTLRW